VLLDFKPQVFSKAAVARAGTRIATRRVKPMAKHHAREIVKKAKHAAIRERTPER